MADPISSISPSSTPNTCSDEVNDPSAVCSAPPQAPNSTPPLTSAPADPGVCSAPNAVKSLVATFSPATAAKALVSALPPHTVVFLGTTSGPSAAGAPPRDGAAVLKGQIDSGVLQGTGIELLSASKQLGTDIDLQLTASRQTLALSYAGYGVAVTQEAAAARVNLGEHNDDGSLGGNIGAVGDLAGRELTLNTPIGSLTAGMSVSVGASGSIGVRDADHDGKPEFCAKFSLPAYTLGACVEKFW